jgi:catechol 2,3-dioxygenase-like lactoylglutathione lyase family enzyme
MADDERLLTRVEFHVSDLAATKSFYAKLGFALVREWQGWALLDRGGSRLGLQEDGYTRSHAHYFAPYLDRSPRGVGAEVCVDVADRDDLDALYAVATEMGAVVREMVERGWGATDFRIADPDGYFVRFTTPLGPLGE